MVTKEQAIGIAVVVGAGALIGYAALTKKQKAAQLQGSLTESLSSSTVSPGNSITVTGTLTANGAPVPATTVTLWLNGMNTNNNATTDSNGNYSITAYFNTPGTYTLQTQAAAYNLTSPAATLTVTQTSQPAPAPGSLQDPYIAQNGWVSAGYYLFPTALYSIPASGITAANNPVYVSSQSFLTGTLSYLTGPTGSPTLTASPTNINRNTLSGFTLVGSNFSPLTTIMFSASIGSTNYAIPATATSDGNGGFSYTWIYPGSGVVDNIFSMDSAVGTNITFTASDGIHAAQVTVTITA